MKRKYIYEDRALDTQSLVLYRALDIISENEQIINGYLEAASILLEPLKGVQFNSKHEQITLPLLLMYVHAIEIALKMYLYKLEEHTGHTRFCAIEHFKLKNSNHDLKDLLDQIIQVNPKKGELHYFPFLEKLSFIVSEFNDFGLDSMSARYRHTKKKETYPLHDKKINIRIFKLHYDIKNICKEIVYYISGKEFFECENGYYSDIYCNQLRSCLEVLLKYKNKFTLIITKDKCNSKKEDKWKTSVKYKGTEIKFFSFADLPVDYFKYVDKSRHKITIFLKTLSKDEIFNIYRALMFYTRNDFIFNDFAPNDSYFLEKIIGLRLFYLNAIKKLESEILRIERIMLI